MPNLTEMIKEWDDFRADPTNKTIPFNGARYGYAIECLKAAISTANSIASWGEGPEVNSSFDEPGSAEEARKLLIKLGVK